MGAQVASPGVLIAHRRACGLLTDVRAAGCAKKVPANTPAEQVEILADALAVAAKDPRFIEVTEQRIRQPVLFMRGDEIKPMLVRQMHEYRTLIDDIGLQ
ncbi:hypothetical protein [Pseudomonas sp. EA_35y_Pfl2_R5]|uniref:hypothetical protein n=1 Tax=Pseudomonas sp. EA_35y_Pfl2_R5 TaxID=3088690 RepID=UPI0030D9E22E